MPEVLYLVRHGRTKSNSKNLFRGDSDVPLTDQGHKDAAEAVDYLSNVQPDFIVCSDRIRAVETAEIFAKTFGHTPIESPKLRAWDVGTFTGKTRDKENLDKLQTYIDNPYLDVPDGESLQDFRDRVLPVIEECFQTASGNGVGFIICHSSIIHELGNQLNGDHKSLIVEPGGIVLLSSDPPSAKPIFKKSTAKNAESIS